MFLRFSHTRMILTESIKTLGTKVTISNSKFKMFPMWLLFFFIFIVYDCPFALLPSIYSGRCFWLILLSHEAYWPRYNLILTQNYVAINVKPNYFGAKNFNSKYTNGTSQYSICKFHFAKKKKNVISFNSGTIFDIQRKTNSKTKRCSKKSAAIKLLLLNAKMFVHVKKKKMEWHLKRDIHESFFSFE